jgi:hypothetical protein
MIKTCKSAARRYLPPILALALAIPSAQAGDTTPQHVLSLDQIRQDLVKQSAARESNEAAIAEFFALPRVQKTLTASGINPDRIRRSVSLLDDKEQAELAARASTATNQIVGGDLTEAQVTLVILAAVGFAYLTVLILAFK